MKAPARRRRARAVLAALVLVLTALALASCAATANPGASAGNPHAAGFWLGLWQGIIVPIAFVVSLFNDHVGISEVHNNGALYDFGYVLGIGVGASIGGATGRASSRRGT